MPNIQFKNFARSTLAIGAASGATSLTLAAGTGSKFPTLTGGQYFYLTLENAALTREIVKVTARTGDVLTVTRAQDNTTAQTWNAGDVASLRLNAKAIEEAVVGTLLAVNNLSDVADAATARANLGAQAADANTAKLNVAQQFTERQRTTPLTDNDLSFDLGAANDFVCTPTGGGTLTFTNITAGCKGEILLVNNSNYTIAKAATVKCPSSMLPTISATGRYRLAYSSLDGTNVDVTASAALS